MKRYLIGTALAALSLAVPAAAQQRTPAAVIVVVDTNRIYNECTACRAAQAQLQTMLTTAQQRQQQLGGPIQTEMQSIQQAVTAAQGQPAGAARTAAEASIRQRAQALDARQGAAQQELQRLEQNLQSTRANVARQIGDRLNPLINQAMTAHGANLALDFDATLAHAQGLDVTAEVLTALNAQLPSVSVTPMPASATPTQPQPQGR
ncbi:MAG TPA: OmpH family outer membrane protein [Allosphingosinicella sp.]|jgi:Skp family chaperone for outer membrane proteins